MPHIVTIILTIIFSLIALIAAYIFVVPESRSKSKNFAIRTLHNIFRFKSLLTEKIVRFFYVLLTIACELYGFFCLFSVQNNFWGGDSKWLGGRGILVMIFGPIVIRLIFEGFMMVILVVKNVIDIRNKLYGEASGSSESELEKKMSRGAKNIAMKLANTLEERNNLNE